MVIVWTYELSDQLANYPFPSISPQSIALSLEKHIFNFLFPPAPESHHNLMVILPSFERQTKRIQSFPRLMISFPRTWWPLTVTSPAMRAEAGKLSRIPGAAKIWLRAVGHHCRWGWHWCSVTAALLKSGQLPKTPGCLEVWCLVFRGWARSILHLLSLAISTSSGLPAEGVGSGLHGPKGLLTRSDILLCDAGLINKGLMASDLCCTWLMVICYLSHNRATSGPSLCLGPLAQRWLSTVVLRWWWEASTLGRRQLCGLLTGNGLTSGFSWALRMGLAEGAGLGGGWVSVPTFCLGSEERCFYLDLHSLIPKLSLSLLLL